MYYYHVTMLFIMVKEKAFNSFSVSRMSSVIISVVFLSVNIH